MEEKQKKTIFYSILGTLVVVAIAIVAVQSLSGDLFSGLTKLDSEPIEKSIPTSDDPIAVKETDTPEAYTTPPPAYVPPETDTEPDPEPTNETESTPIEVSNTISYVFDWDSDPTFVNRGDIFEVAFDTSRDDLPYTIMVWKDANGSHFWDDVSIAEASGFTEQSVFSARRVDSPEEPVYQKTGPTRDLGTGKNYLRWLVPSNADISQYFYAIVWINEGSGGVKLLDYGKITVGQPG